MDRADFLQMLTAQLKAQDPLDPLSGQDFASQLATFSQLQELQGMGSTLDQSLNASLLLTQTFSNTMAASLIGKVVRAESNEVQLGTTGAANLTYTLDAAATDITIEIRDAAGTVVRTLTPSAQAEGEQTVSWDGLSSDGKRAAADSYTFTVSARDADGNTVNAGTYAEGRVTQIRYDNGMVYLMIGDRQFTLSSVLSIRESESGQKG